MRHVRIMGLCLVAMFAVSAMTLGVASPALAITKKEEKAIAKNWGVFKNCPWNNPKTELCTYGATYGGAKGGFYTIGSAKVALSHVVIQGGIHENEATEELTIIAPEDGAQTLESPPEPVTGGLKLITPEIQQRAEWPEALKEAYKEALKSHEGKLDAKIEVGGGNVIYETEGVLNTTNLIFETGTAFKLPIKVKLESPFLEKLGGGPCVVGNETTPIWQELTSSPKDNGTAGSLEILYEGNEVFLHGGRLGDDGWEIPSEADAQGCGGAYESYVNKAINLTLGQGGYGTAQGLTLLSGELGLSVSQVAKEVLEEGKQP